MNETNKTRHPKALPFLCLTELWERFGFYVVQGMLVLYMTKAFGFTDDESFTITGTFSALAYIAPWVGGYLADRILGFKLAILIGGIFLSAGYGLLATTDHHLFYVALATIVVGNGLFKPNISSLLGALYKPGDASRDAGFTIFYIGINLGVLLAGISSGAIQEKFGWYAGFATASVGLLIGLATFGLGVKYARIEYQPEKPFIKHFLINTWMVIIYCLASIALISLILQTKFLAKWLLPTIGVIILIFIFVLAQRQPKQYRLNIYTLNVLIISSVVFWAIFLQMFFATNLFIDRIIDRDIFGFHIPTTVFYSLESVFVILAGPFFAWFWQDLSQHNKNPSSVFKFVMALVLIGIGFLTLSCSTFFINSEHLINPLWIVLAYFFVTIGELLLSPIGLAAVTTLSPSHLVGMMMGLWFVALGFGGQFAGWLARIASLPKNGVSLASELSIYRHAFFYYALLAFGVAIILFFIYLAFFKRRHAEMI